MTTLDQAIAQMRGAGMPDFPPGHPKTNTDRIVRYGPKKKAWYRLYEYLARNNRYYIVGGYGMWGEIEPPRQIESDWQGVDQDERERIERSQAELKAREQQKRAERALFASRRGEQQWNEARKAKPEQVETYIDRKGVRHETGIRYLGDGTVLVPMIRYDITPEQQAKEGYTGPRRLVGLQKIAPDGTKRFNKGVGMEGAACRLGGAPKAGDLIIFTEGLSTGLTLRMATDGKHPVFVAFNAGNLPAAAAIVRKRFPASPFLFCADDDAYLEASLNRLLRENFGVTEFVHPPTTDRGITTRHGPGLVSAEWVADGAGVPGIVGAMRYPDRVYALARTNAGRTYAHRAATAVGNAGVVYPVFADRKLSPDPDTGGKLTDYNDLHKAEGLAVVRRQLATELDRLLLSIQVRGMMKEIVREAKTASKPQKEKPERHVDWKRFFKRYTYIYPSDTVWDAEHRKIVRLTHVKIDRTERVVNTWLESSDRRTVRPEQVVFDPSGQCAEECINLFNGMPLRPSADGECERLLELLQHLCGESGGDQGEIMPWVLRWLAYPLQHPGAKMESALVMHGPDEGTGKNLFFRAIRQIYGEYASLITQAELESPYNAWISQRLFVIANEVISRAEMKHHVGKLKNYITESPLPIRDLYMPIRYEDNHMNAVFLTNELHALQISPGDRRYMVIRTPGGLSREFYQAVVRELSHSGAAALYQKLLEFPLGDFDEHTKPPMTAAKEELVEQSYNSAQFFQHELKEGRIGDVVYGPCLVRDLYELYLAWCPRVGHKNPLPLNRFSAEFMAMNGVRRIDKARVVDPDRPEEKALLRSALKQKAIFVMGARPEDREENAWWDDEIGRFREALIRFLRGRRSRDGSGDSDQGWLDDRR